MRKVYMSFLGLGPKINDTFGYHPARYQLNNQISTSTPFVQAAEMEILNGADFNLVLIVATQKSYDTHFGSLKIEMQKHNVFPVHTILEEDFSAEGQWKWFETIMCCMEPRDRLTVDLTHGYRAIPIIFSTAINFLQKSKDIHLDAVYYGAYEADNDFSPIVDMKHFYVVNEWAEAVSRLIEDADARKMAQLAEESRGIQVGELNDQKLIKALDNLTNAVRNVDVNTVAKKANLALDLVKTHKKSASPTGNLLLSLVLDKFISLTTDSPVSGRYDADYFRVQLSIARLLLEHRLYMQAFTVMREFIASIAMISRPDMRMSNRKGRDKREVYGEVFVQMVHRNRDDWKFSGNKQNITETLLPLYEDLNENGLIERIRLIMGDLVTFRNGFDHAWTAKVADFQHIETKGNTIITELEEIFSMMIELGILKK